MTISDILDLPIFDSIWLAAPCEGYLEKPVVDVGVLDHEPFSGEFDAFRPGSIIFTTAPYAIHDDVSSDLIDNAFIELMKRDVAGIAIKPVVLKSISPRVAAMSAQTHIPLFFYKGRYPERIIADVMALIGDNEVDSKRTKIIDRILAPSDEDDVRASMFEIAQMTGATVQCFAASAVADDNLALHALKDRLAMMLDHYEHQWDDVERTFVCHYRDTLLGFISFKRPPQSVITISEADLELCLGRVGPLIAGIGQEVALGEGDLTIRQARAALEIAKERKQTTLRWSAMGLEAFRVAGRTDRLFSQAAAFNAAILEEYDAAHGANLVETARAFARNYGEVTATAEALFQHRNTIHYRLRKIKDAFGFKEMSDRELAFFLMLVYL